MTELEKIEYAKSFMDKLANGINPLDDSQIPEEDIANNVRLSRCFFYVSDILRQVIENGGVRPVKVAKPRKQEFALTEEQRSRIQISERPLPISEIANRLNELIDAETTKKLSATAINNWLVELQMLEAVTQSDGKVRKLPTEQGRELGIFTEERTGMYGSYVTVLFSPSAQQFVYDNIEAAVASKSEQEDPLAEFHGRPWTEAQDESLSDLFRRHTPIPEIAFALKRTESGIRSRLKKQGLLNSD